MKKAKGKFFKYPESDRIFELTEIKNNNYYFKCGHWCTNSVFIDLIDLSTGLAQWQIPKQLTFKF